MAIECFSFGDKKYDLVPEEVRNVSEPRVAVGRGRSAIVPAWMNDESLVTKRQHLVDNAEDGLGYGDQRRKRSRNGDIESGVKSMSDRKEAKKDRKEKKEKKEKKDRKEKKEKKEHKEKKERKERKDRKEKKARRS
jgi:nucleolar protein 58